MSEISERTLPSPDLGDGYQTFWRRLVNQDIQKRTLILLEREGVGAERKGFNLEMDVPSRLIHLLRLRSKRDGYYGNVADLLTITKDCQTKFIINLAPESGEGRDRQPVSLSYGLVVMVRRKVVGKYELILGQGQPPKVDFKVVRGLGYKKIPGWVFKLKEAGERDFEIIRDTLDFVVEKDPSRILYEREFIEHQRQIRGDRLYIDDYSQEARDIEAEARERVLRDWPGATIADLK